MAYTGEQLEASTQLERARASLGEALGLTQDIGNSELDVQHVSAALARSVQNIFKLQTSGLVTEEAPSHIEQAMNHLRETLVLLQDVRSDSSAMSKITSTVARILALLYPVSKIIEQIKETTSVHHQKEAPLDLQPNERVSSLPSDARERRNNSRRIINVDIGIHSHTNFFTGFTQDISSGGLFVATYDILKIGTKINVNFNVPKGPVLSLDGIVRWIREYNERTPDVEPGMGIQFGVLSRDDSNAINEYIAKNPPIFYDDE